MVTDHPVHQQVLLYIVQYYTCWCVTSCSSRLLEQSQQHIHNQTYKISLILFKPNSEIQNIILKISIIEEDVMRYELGMTPPPSSSVALHYWYHHLPLYCISLHDYNDHYY